MTPNATRLEAALRMQAAHVQALLDHQQRDESDFHLALAGVLRSMLCDADCPTLLALARELSINLRVWGPYPPEAKKEKPPSFTMNALVMSAEPAAFAYEMSIEQFLDAPLGAVTVADGSGGKPRSTWYTPRQLIKWAANKEGPAHFDPKPAATFHAIGSSVIASGEVSMVDASGETPITRNDNLPHRIAFLQMAQATAVLSERVLERCASSGV
jgi:hypothetical protein